ncbi:DnaT-like ssDNA-binding domain-containing protein [Serratia marcescens]|uniref:DnaT-like ssDNA-binding domain-containing protein n=1 Tax=Serratia marcescens TaxID=615 RepID=UPI0027737D76|nr:DnaT-like ssDNA-binding domain-containing protein [Serratia marcescens]MDP8601541.1 DnaT-like ssDNA-binding domain-containing protein [Serratia marcescens]MDP8686241.1 DnaT-like ssDNA-binding domain-containing protein [Serratia marcescens]MDP8735817.1 DnaT-like ssDNA-binding domain-containing protein [Serratia marcescens]MDP8795139.1 DnaT-like ssDNA-binding domain-containing protein [Serratia marcescens]
MAEVSEAACLLAIGLLNYADDEGYFNANPKLIKSAVFPIREPSVSIPVMLRELSNHGYLSMFYTSDNRQFGLIKNFAKHQVVNKPRPSKIKEMELLPYDYGSTTGSLPLGMDQGSGNGKDKTPLCAREKNLPADPPQEQQPPFPLNGNQFGKFTMHNGWQPGTDFQRMAATWGMKIAEPVTSEELQEFIGYWEPEGKAFHQAQWEQKLARSVLMSRARKTTGVKNHETGKRPDGTTGHWRGNAAEGVYAALTEQLRSDGLSESQIRKILDEDDGDLFGSVDGEERQGTVVTLEAGDYSAH